LKRLAKRRELSLGMMRNDDDACARACAEGLPPTTPSRLFFRLPVAFAREGALVPKVVVEVSLSSTTARPLFLLPKKPEAARTEKLVVSGEEMPPPREDLGDPLNVEKLLWSKRIKPRCRTQKGEAAFPL